MLEKGPPQDDDQHDSTDLPPRPKEVLDADRIHEHRLATLSTREYRQLAQDIQERGVIMPVVMDPDGTILDGHHRMAICVHYDLLSDDPRAPAFRVVPHLEGDVDEAAWIIRQHCLGRDMTKERKDDLVEMHLKERWTYDADREAWLRGEAYQTIADQLGVDRRLVNRIANQRLDNIVKKSRVDAIEYHQQNPDAPMAEVARAVGVSPKTAKRWLEEKQDTSTEEDEDDQQRSLGPITCQNEREAQDAQALVQAAEDQAARAAKYSREAATGSMDPSEAKKKSNQERRRKQSEEERTDRAERYERRDRDNQITLYEGSFQQVVQDQLKVETVDHIFTDPPYDRAAVEEGTWHDLANVAVDTLRPGGLLIAYMPSAHYEQSFRALTDAMHHYHGMILDQRKGKTPPVGGFLNEYRTVDLFLSSGEQPEFDHKVRDVISLGQREKEYDRDQQSIASAREILKRLTEPDDLILDPMAGTGTFGIAAAQTQRRAIMIERDPDQIETIQSRIVDEVWEDT